MEYTEPERRSHPRRTMRIDGWTALAPEPPLPRCETIEAFEEKSCGIPHSENHVDIPGVTHELEDDAQ